MKPVKEELRRMEKLGVITRVLAAMVVVPKGNGKVRICVDLTHLNRSVLRERHPLPAVEQSLAQLAGLTTLDANSGFWQIPLDRESALLTTFITQVLFPPSPIQYHQNTSSDECLIFCQISREWCA